MESSSRYILKLLLPLSGLAESGDYGHAKFTKHLTRDSGMQAISSDMLLCFKSTNGKPLDYSHLILTTNYCSIFILYFFGILPFLLDIFRFFIMFH